MSNYEKLKELAEATKGWDNLKSCWPEETEDGDLEVNWFVGAVTEDDDKYPVLEVNTAQYDALEDAGRLARYYAAANPSAVAALIAENERLSADCSSMRGSLKANAVSIKKLIKDGGRAARERDQLRAEVAGLRTGYEAYERVNAELKAENEVLKKRIDDMSPFKGAPLTGPDLKCLACGEYHYGLQGLPCPNMRITASAALGRGEQP